MRSERSEGWGVRGVRSEGWRVKGVRSKKSKEREE